MSEPVRAPRIQRDAARSGQCKTLPAEYFSSPRCPGDLPGAGPAARQSALDGARHAAGLAGLRGWRLRSCLVLLSFLKDGEALEKSALRGPAVVLVAILAFAMTIRPFSFGPLDRSRPWHGGGGAARDPHRRLRDRGRQAPAASDFGAQSDALLHGAVRRPPQPADPDLPAKLRQSVSG